MRPVLLFAVMAAALVAVGMGQSWSVALAILNLCVISAIMSMGVNMQWGYAGLLNLGVMGFAALGGLAAVLVSQSPDWPSIQAGGGRIALSALIIAITIGAIVVLRRRMAKGGARTWATIGIGVIGYVLARQFFAPGVDAVEAVNAAQAGYLGGLGLPIIFSWLVGGLFAAGAAWVVGRVALGLRSDYLAIATLGISEIIIAVLKNEDWLTRGVKNVTGLSRPTPYEINLQQADWFLALCERIGADPIPFSGIFVKLCYFGLFAAVLLIILWLAERALNSPWGRMMRAIRDNEVAAEAMGKDVVARRRQIFILGAAVVGVAGAMLTTLDGQFTPASYQPLRFTFLIWVMVIVGGSGNNWGAVLGGFLIWFTWIEAEPVGLWLMDVLTSGLAEDNGLRAHLLESAPHMRLILMGLILIVVLRFSPSGLIPEARRR